MANLPLAFGELLAGGVLMVAGATGTSIADTLRGQVTMHPFPNPFGSSSGNASSTTTGPLPKTSGPVENQIAQAGHALGFNTTAIAGLIGNATQESSLNPSINVSGCRGLFCWNPGANPQAAQVQLGNVAQQIKLAAQALGPAGIRAMNNAGSPAAAATYFEQNFERAGVPDMQNRIAAAEQAFAQGL